MSTDILKVAEARIAEIDHERAELVSFIRTYKRLSNQQASQETIDGLLAGARKPAGPSTARGNSLAGALEERSKTAETEGHARRFIEREGRPLRLGELSRRFESAGIEITGKNPTNTLGARLSNSKSLVTLKDFGWWLVERAYEPAGYVSPEAEPADETVGPSAGDVSVTPPSGPVEPGQGVVHDNIT